MELIEQLQKLVPWAVELQPVPKTILSVVLAGLTALILTVIWTTPTEIEKQSIAAVEKILKGCYRRAVFTRTHAQMSHEAMFSSISECRQLVQIQVPEVRTPSMAQPAADLISALEGIEKEKTKLPWDFSKIDLYKLETLKRLTLLSKISGATYTIPKNLTEDTFFSKEEADLPPTMTPYTP